MKLAKSLAALVFVAVATFLSAGTASAATGPIPCNSINIDPCCGFRACDGPS